MWPHHARRIVTADKSFDAEFRLCFDEHFPMLFRYIDRMSGDAALAADVAQDTFLRLYRRGTMPDNVIAWLATVATNRFRDERRREGRRLRLLARRAPEEFLGDASPAPDAEMAPNEQAEAVRAALAALPERDRQLLLLRHEGYSYRDLAVILRLGPTSIGTMLSRARAAFRVALLNGEQRVPQR